MLDGLMIGVDAASCSELVVMIKEADKMAQAGPARFLESRRAADVEKAVARAVKAKEEEAVAAAAPSAALEKAEAGSTALQATVAHAVQVPTQMPLASGRATTTPETVPVPKRMKTTLIPAPAPAIPELVSETKSHKYFCTFVDHIHRCFLQLCFKSRASSAGCRIQLIRQRKYDGNG